MQLPRARQRREAADGDRRVRAAVQQLSCVTTIAPSAVAPSAIAAAAVAPTTVAATVAAAAVAAPAFLGRWLCSG